MKDDRIEAATLRRAGRMAKAVALMAAVAASALVGLGAGHVPSALAQPSVARAASASGRGQALHPAALATGPLATRTAWTDSDVYDAGAYWRFARLEGFYRIDGHVVACVQKADGHWDFWDPRRDALLGTKNLDCLPPSGSRSVDPTVVSHQIVGATGSVETDASFSGATGVWWQPDDFQHCDRAFVRVYTAEGSGGANYGFYVLTRLRHPRPVDLSQQACSMVPGVVTLKYNPRYADDRRVQALDLGDHRTLLVTRDDDERPAVLVLHDRPAHPWTNAQGVSIVPAALLQPALDEAGADYLAREHVVVKLLEASH
ncbi:MAG TPA: hypothetical protein VH328_17045 [Burkholderiaceae bacterium]|nr:hypothetical protein [Burkholderiaceae bacterium]